MSPRRPPAETASATAATTAATEAHARILATIRAIPPGQVRGYGEVAVLAGLPGRARLVARLLGGNTDAALPWHRVLRSDGRIAFPEGSRGYREQCQRLRAEGVVVQGGRVKRGPKPARDLDAEVWGPR
ncbi:MGMT family protein [Xanthomonas sp. A2111]|uniref:MGMT family protein n=1 Tax=Xanthomonas hawaiiensis TaxID=3003247 RepID=A0ABU2I191_9XANT|nr:MULTISPECIES: MGMT family protein [unclassified Xanthomonas]MBO9830046.1 MGMT family protein [Xanthomonas sp. A2111]MBO9874877.1 MGMT family protein [Xanthomonas sp. D-93]MDS9991876.1 MGMT family protein [Xanthomonas sp. A2111]WNH43678.1 MGMT family protein [Xanthomonas sp. A6251]